MYLFKLSIQCCIIFIREQLFKKVSLTLNYRKYFMMNCHEFCNIERSHWKSTINKA